MMQTLHGKDAACSSAQAVDMRWLQLQKLNRSSLNTSQVDKIKPAPGQRNRFKVRLEGEAITSDSFMELMEAHKAEKEHK